MPATSDEDVSNHPLPFIDPAGLLTREERNLVVYRLVTDHLTGSFGLKHNESCSICAANHVERPIAPRPERPTRITRSERPNTALGCAGPGPHTHRITVVGERYNFTIGLRWCAHCVEYVTGSPTGTIGINGYEGYVLEPLIEYNGRGCGCVQRGTQPRWIVTSEPRNGRFENSYSEGHIGHGWCDHCMDIVSSSQRRQGDDSLWSGWTHSPNPGYNNCTGHYNSDGQLRHDGDTCPEHEMSVRLPDPDLERLLAEEEEIERRRL